MAQTVSVPGVGDLEFPDGMSQPDMAAAIRRNFPQIHPVPPPGAAPRIPTGVPSIDNAPYAPVAPPQAPTMRDRIVGGIQGAMDTAQSVIEGLGGMFGSGAGALGATVGAIQTKLTGGVQPDSDAVRAVTGPAPAGAPDALAEGAQQGAQSAVSALRGLNSRDANGIAARLKLTNGLGALATPQSQDVAGDVQGGITDIMSRMDPGVVLPTVAAARAPAGAAPRGAGVIDQALNAGAQAVQTGKQAVGDAARAAGGVVPAAVAKALGKPDPELVRIAQLADQFPHRMEIPPDRLLPEGAQKSVGQELGSLPLSGGAARDTANRQAITRNTIDQLMPGSDATRLNDKTLSASIAQNGEVIGQGYRDAGDIPMAELRDRLDLLAERARQHGSDELGRIITNRSQELLGKADADGNIAGETLREWDSDVGRQARMTGDEELASHLSDLQNAARDAAMSRLSPEQAQGVTDARRRYAYSMLLAPSVAKAGKESSVIGLDGLVRPGKLISAVTSTRAGSDFVARGRGGALADLARVGQLLDNTTKAKATGLTAATRNTIGAGVGATAGRVYNKAAAGATERMLPEPPTPPAPPPELELAPPGEPLGPGGGGGGGPAAAGPLGDLTPDWGTAPGAGVPAAPTVDAAGLYNPVAENHEPLPAPGGVAAPAIEAAPARGAGAQIPAVPGRPDLPDALVSGAPAETAASEQANVAMGEPGAVEARRQQGTPAEAAPEPAAAPAPKATPDEQRRLDEIDAQITQTKSDIVRETLTKARGKVEREIGARDTVEKTKAAADELRTAAMTMTDPSTREALIARADKLDPPPKIPAGEVKEGQPPIAGSEAPTKPLPAGKATEGQPDITPPAAKKPIPQPRVTYLDDPAWRKAHGLGDEDANAALRMRDAFDFDPEGVAAAAQKHDNNPKALDAAVAKILEKRDANPGNSTAGSGEGAATEARKPGGAPAAAGAQPGPDGAAAPGSGGQGGQQGGQDPHVEAADRARFELAHPRGVDGQFVTPVAEPRNLMSEWRAARQKFMAATDAGNDYEASVHAKHMNDLALEIRKQEK